MRGRLSVLFTLSLVLLAASAAEGQALFNNFPVSGQISAFQVNAGYSASNSFTLTSSSTIGEVNFGAWVTTGDSVNGVTWAIGTTPYDTSLGTGVAGATSSYDLSNVDGFDVVTVTFATSSITLPAGTYYLTLSAAASASGNAVYWDINDGAGIDAWDSSYGHVSATNVCFQTIGISGTCASSFQLLSTSPGLTALPVSISFPNQTVNTTSTAQGVTITNNGAGPATITGIAITGTNPGDFAQTNNCPVSPTTLATSGFCTVNTTFTPQAANPRSAAITVTGSSPLSVGLSGTGTQVPSTVTLSTLSISFPNQNVNTVSSSVPITVTNSGPSPLTINSIAVAGVNLVDFAETNNCPISPAMIAVNASCQINVTFMPQAAGPLSAAIAITDNGNGSPQSVGLGGTGVTPTLGAWPNGYLYQATFTVAAGQVPSAQTNFPALISGAYADFAASASGGRVDNTCTQAVGNNSTAVPCDLIFTSDAAGTVLLNWEFETWTAATGAINVWVNVPNLANGTVIYAWYGNPAVTTLQTTPSSTWSNNFEAVYHMKENPSGTAPQLNDSTSNSNSASMTGPAVAAQQQPGEIDGSVNFEGNTWASLANPANFSFERTDSFSLSGWFNIPSNSAATLLAKFPALANSGWAVMQQPGASSPWFALGLFGQNNAATFALAHTPSVSLGTWHYMVATYSGTSTTAGMNIYVDGVNQTLTTLSNNLSTSIVNAVAPTINSRATASQISSDTMDEIRVSTKGVVFSQAWVTTSYNNESKPATFFTVATGLTNSGAPAATLAPSSIPFPNQTVSTTSAAMSATLSNTGSAPLTGITASITGANPGDFAITTGVNACGATVAAGSSCSIYVTFTPASATGFIATLSVADNASGSPQTASLTGTGVPPVLTPWPNGYLYQATFTVAAGQVPIAQTNFPALISGAFADFAASANGGRISNTCTQAVGNNSTTVPCDLIFTSDAAGTALLNWEFENWTAATGAVNIWVNVPNLANGTVIYAWYGNPAVTTLQTTPSAAWSSNFEAVYHMKEDPSGTAPQLNDSTANANSASMTGPTVAAQQQPGEIDGSINFEGNTWASLANPANFSFERTDSFSLSGWFKLASNSTETLIAKFPAVSNAGWALLQQPGASSPWFALGLFGQNNAATFTLAHTPSVSLGTWHYMVATYSGTSTTAGMNIYVDGVNQTLTTLSNNLATSIVNNLTPTINSRATASQISSDSMDEIRVSTRGVVFSQAWVTASYNNESKPATFFTVATGLTNP